MTECPAMPAVAAPSPPPDAGPDLRVHTALVFVQLVFGAFHVVARAVLYTLPPLAVAGLRLALATPLLLALAWHRDRLLPSPRDLPWLALLGFLGVFANQILFLTGLSFTTAINATILMPSIPVFAVALGALFRVEGIGRRRLAGIALAVAGALVLLDPRRLTLGDEVTLGNLLILANCLCYAGFLVAQRPVLARLPWRTVIAWAFLFGASGVLVVSWGELSALEAAAVPQGAWWGIAYIVLFPTVLAYSLNTWAVRRSSPALVAVYTTLQPVFGSSLAALFLGERFGLNQAGGFVLIATGLWVTARALQQRRQPAGGPTAERP